MLDLDIKNDCSVKLANHPDFAFAKMDSGRFSIQSCPKELKRHQIVETALLASKVFIVSSGVVGLQHYLNDGRRSISTLYLSGDVIDLRHSRNSNGGNLVALSLVNICQFEGVDYDEILNDSPNQRREFLSNSKHQLDVITKHCVDLGKKSAAEKFSSFLFECRSRQKFSNGKSIDLLLHRVDIADYLGLRHETLSRVIGKLERFGLIKIEQNNQLRIVDMAALRQIANGATLPRELAI